MKLKNPFASLTRFEWGLWIVSVLTVTLSCFLSPEQDYLKLVGSLIGVTALIFLARGLVIGQFLMIIFCLFYGFVSYRTAYYGEMLTYVGMSLPMAVMSAIAWIRHPYRDTDEVEVSRVSSKQKILLPILTVLVTVAFYFILGALHTDELLISTVSVATSFIAAYLTFLRSPWYALAYTANDVILIVLWILAIFEDPSALPMVICFFVFFFNDMYVFFSWRRMAKRQSEFFNNL